MRTRMRTGIDAKVEASFQQIEAGFESYERDRNNSWKDAERRPVATPERKGPRVRVKKPKSEDRELEMAIRRRAAEAKAKLYELCRADVNAFCEFVLIDDASGRAVEQTEFHLDFQRHFDRYRQMVVMAHPESGKALALTTEIPTPTGWTTMGDLEVGDVVFSGKGRPCKVTFATEVQRGRRVFEIEFEDGSTIKADADHRWVARKHSSLTKNIVTTDDMRKELTDNRGRYVWAVPCTKPLQYRQGRKVPFEPYEFGTWLCSSEVQPIELSSWEDVAVGGQAVARKRKVRRELDATPTRVRWRLRKLGVLEAKQIPAVYLEASEKIRTTLLVGLMDAAGSIDSQACAELILRDERLAEDALMLIRSLGFRAKMTSADGKWTIAFKVHELALSVHHAFQAPRSAKTWLLAKKSTAQRRCSWKQVVSIREIQSEPVRCIQVDSADHTYVCGRGFTVTHNTNQAIGRVLWELGNNPNIRVMLLYNSEDSAMKTLATIRRYIETSGELRAVFPNLKRGEIWKDDAIVVARTAYSRDPSVVAVGYNSRRIQGSRVDLLIVDDLLDSVVTGTEGQRKKISSWVKNTVFTRLTDGARCAFLTNAWHPRDLSQELVKERGWYLLKRPIRNKDGKIWWSHWSEQRLALMKRTLGSLEYARSYDCDPRDDGARVFRPEHVDYALKRGSGYGFLDSIDLMPDRCIVVTGVDLAAALDDKKSQGAKTVITSVFFHPNQDRQVIRIKSGRWRATQILRELISVGAAFPRQHWVVVENNGVQRWILELADQNEMDVGVPLIPFATGKNKADPRFGVASMAAEYEGRRWILPNSCYTETEQDEVRALTAQLIDYVPEAHTGDHLMSLWFAREIGRKIFARFFKSDDAEDTERASGGGSVVRAIG